MTEIALFDLNPRIDRAAAAAEFRRDKRLQLRDFLVPEAAATIADLLERGTPWGLASQSDVSPARQIRREQMAAMQPDAIRDLFEEAHRAAAKGAYSFVYGQYPLLEAYLGKWQPGSPFDLLLEHINSEPLLNLVREVTGLPDLIKADAQATVYGPGHFLQMHDDSHKEEGWRVAYVMNFARDWRPDFGGYLMFYDEEGDVVAGFRPRFNALNMFLVPQRHNVTYVPPFAPVRRFAITGWFRNR